MILCKTGLAPIKTLTDMCYIFLGETCEAFLSPPAYL